MKEKLFFVLRLEGEVGEGRGGRENAKYQSSNGEIRGNLCCGVARFVVGGLRRDFGRVYILRRSLGLYSGISPG